MNKNNYVRVLLHIEVEKESLETADSPNKAVRQTHATIWGKSTTWEVFKELVTRKEASSAETAATGQVADCL